MTAKRHDETLADRALPGRTHASAMRTHERADGTPALIILPAVDAQHDGPAPARSLPRGALGAGARWLRANTFVPGWLPARWRHPAAGYIAAALLQLIASLVTLLLPQLVPTFAFPGLLEVAVVALVAISWGAGPSLCASLIGVVLLEWLVLPHSFGHQPVHAGDAMEIGWFLLISLGLGAVTGHTERDRRRAVQERAETAARETALRELTERTDAFLSLASHELRAPLTVIMVSLQLIGRRLERVQTQKALASAEPAPGMRPLFEALAYAEQQVDRQNRLIGDLLDVSRIRAGKLEFRFQPCDLAAIVRDAVEELQLTWPERALSVQGVDEQVMVHADPDRIGQVVTNLMTNALKYSPADQPVTVALRCEGSVAQVHVRDHGPGLTPEQQRHLWERFHRVPGIKQQGWSGAGLGLGLYIVRSMVERHGGQVSVESAPGNGSTFSFTLPVQQ